MSDSNDLPPATTKKASEKKPSLLTTRRAKLLLLIALVLILVGSSLLLATKTQGGSSAPGSRGTPTSAPTPTHTLPLTPELLFSDNFLTNRQGWLVGSASGYTRTLQDGILTLTDTNHKPLIESLPTNQSFDDFDLTTTFTLVQAAPNDGVGIYLRGDSNLDHDYRIQLAGDNTYSITKESLNLDNTPQDTVLVRPAHTHLLHSKGQSNTLEIIMRGSTLILLVNTTVVATVSDTDYTHGQIALFVQNSATSSGVTATFTGITVYTVPTTLPHA